MRLSWNEIKVRAASFASEWADAAYEKGETQSFYNDFFHIFGMTRRRVASFEEPVKKLGDRRGFIDLFWKGTLLVEQKSAGRNLEKAKQQALDYFPGIKEAELPRFVLACDFQNFELFDLETSEELRFPLSELPTHVQKFGFMIGQTKRVFKDQDPVNILAAEQMGKLHDALKASGYDGHDLEQLLVRLLFCLFAEDTGIFQPLGMFTELITDRTSADGSDVGARLMELFQTLNRPEHLRQKALDEDLAKFPYVNGALFAEPLQIPSFNSSMRKILLEACEFNWETISPAIFGSLFQSVMLPKERRAKGAHYTTEKNILKLIGPLFLDDLRAEFVRIKDLKRDRERRLREFHDKLAGLTFFDPACGCGNFLVITYRELRALEIEVLVALRAKDTNLDLDAATLSRIDVNQFYGIELDEFPARIAEVAMWMMDHIMNNRLSVEFGQVYARIPLKASPNIVQGDALEIDWTTVIAPGDCSFILGNPPFVGHQNREPKQVKGMHRVWGVSGQYNRLDFVTCWFKKAADFAKGQKTEFALVSTNSITQGEQAGILWPWLFSSGFHIRFAHRTFQWNSEARGQAAVHCVIVGLSQSTPSDCVVFDYESPKSESVLSVVPRLNGYLVNGPQWAVPARGKAQAGQKRIFQGSKPADGARLKRPEGGYDTFSNLIMDADDGDRLINEFPQLNEVIRPYVGSEELISGVWRYCLWLKNANPKDYKDIQELRDRLARVRTGRLKSPTISVQKFADYPTLFTQDRQPSECYIAIPEVSSESRDYIPIAMLEAEVVASNKLMIMPGGTITDFAVLTSRMHMAWMRTVAGRLKSDYSYSPSVFFTFPMPNSLQLGELDPLAQTILDSRAAHQGATLADLYDPDSMPPDLRKAHKALDLAVDRLYRKEPFANDRERVEHLFMLYETMTSSLLASAKPKKRGRK